MSVGRANIISRLFRKITWFRKIKEQRTTPPPLPKCKNGGSSEGGRNSRFKLEIERSVEACRLDSYRLRHENSNAATAILDSTSERLKTDVQPRVEKPLIAMNLFDTGCILRRPLAAQLAMQAKLNRPVNRNRSAVRAKGAGKANVNRPIIALPKYKRPVQMTETAINLQRTRINKLESGNYASPQNCANVIRLDAFRAPMTDARIAIRSDAA